MESVNRFQSAEHFEFAVKTVKNPLISLQCINRWHSNVNERVTFTCTCYLCCQDNQVPVCPLCNSPVPLSATGALPDEVVGRHIDNDCQSETAQSRRKVRNVLWPSLVCLLHMCSRICRYVRRHRLEQSQNPYSWHLTEIK